MSIRSSSDIDNVIHALKRVKISDEDESVLVPKDSETYAISTETDDFSNGLQYGCKRQKVGEDVLYNDLSLQNNIYSQLPLLPTSEFSTSENDSLTRNYTNTYFSQTSSLMSENESLKTKPRMVNNGTFPLKEKNDNEMLELKPTFGAYDAVLSKEDYFQLSSNKENMVLRDCESENYITTSNFNNSNAPQNAENKVSNTQNNVRLTLKELQQSIFTCPDEKCLAEDPEGLRSEVTLKPHQKRALAWLMWREQQNPKGGILADDMGLGKTLSMIALVLKTKEIKLNFHQSSGENSECNDGDKSETENERPVLGGTLVVCPTSVIHQWENEILDKCKDGVLKVLVYHGKDRGKDLSSVAKYDIVITSYNQVRVHGGYLLYLNEKDVNILSKAPGKGVLHIIKWERIILDEAHVIRNSKCQTSDSACHLNSCCRWALTGTPIHNSGLDLHSIFKFLRCSYFVDELACKKLIWKANCPTSKRLNVLLKTIMLRRTKQELEDSGAIERLPEKILHLNTITLDDEEFDIYERVLAIGKAFLVKFLKQRAQKQKGKLESYLSTNRSSEKNKLYKVHTVKQCDLLEILLRLRQICCHVSLILSIIDTESLNSDEIKDKNEKSLDIISLLNNFDSNSKTLDSNNNKETVKNILMSNPAFETNRMSSKMRRMFELLEKEVLPRSEKAVIVSQWTSMLNIIGDHLETKDISYEVFSGSVPVHQRMAIVERFNNPDTQPQVLLLSLTAGGVGLNLIGGSHLFIFDIHWNPQIEAQACDRVHRLGQTKTVHIYKFLCEETIEEQIDLLQKRKLNFATDVLNGARKTHINKLTIDDIRMIFGI